MVSGSMELIALKSFGDFTAIVIIQRYTFNFPGRDKQFKYIKNQASMLRFQPVPSLLFLKNTLAHLAQLFLTHLTGRPACCGVAPLPFQRPGSLCWMTFG